MGILSKIIPQPRIEPSANNDVDEFIIPLVLLKIIDYDEKQGYEGESKIQQYTYIIGHFIETTCDDIPVNRYDWGTQKEHIYSDRRPLAYSETLNGHLKKGYQNHTPKLLHRRVSDDILSTSYFRLTEHTDEYLDNYFENHCSVSRREFRQAVITILSDEIGEIRIKKDLHDILVDIDPETFFD